MLAVGSYSNCTIKVKDAKNNQSKSLAVTAFDVAVLYNATVNIPDSFSSSRSAASFVVTEIDPATGKITKEIPINNASQNGDGTWGVNVTTNPNAAKLLIVHKNSNAPTVCINCNTPPEVVYAPITNTTIDVNPITTVTFDETIGTETPLTLEEMDDLMTGVDPLESSLPAPAGGGQTLDQYLEVVADTFEHEIGREIYIAASIPAKPLNDTGITTCGDYAYGGSGTHNNDLVCATYGVTATTAGTDANGDPIPAGQDAHFGRDANPATNSDSDGHKGFSFTKLGADGAALPIQNGTWNDAGSEAAGTKWSCVKDNVTGLIWEVKTNDGGLRDKDWTYTWYSTNSSNNGGSAGTADGGNGCYTTTRCDTEKFVADVNAASLCGSSGWRLPTQNELKNIRVLNRVNPSIEVTFFPNTQGTCCTSAFYWTSTPYSLDSAMAWIVTFYNGDERGENKNIPYYVRLVNKP